MLPWLAGMLLALVASFPVEAAIAFRAASSASVLTQVGITPAYVSNANNNSSNNNVNLITINKPAGLVSGHVMIAQVTLRGTSQTITAPAGWAALDQTSTSTAGSEITQAVFWKVATATEPANYTWSWSTSVRVAGAIMAFSNVETVYPVDVWGVRATNNSATITLPNLTTTTDNAMLVALLGSGSGGSSHSAATGMTERYDVATAAGPNGITISGDTLLNTSYGATGAKISTAATAADNMAHLVALRPLGALTVNVPTGTVANDVMIASVVYRPCSNVSGGACTTTITAPSGWTLVRNVNTTTGGGTDGYGSRLLVYQRVATSAEPVSYTWYFGGTPVQAGAVGGILSFSGVDTANPIDVENGQTTASGTTHAAPGITTTVANAMLVGSYSVNSSGAWTPPAGMTESVDKASRTVGDALGVSLEMNYQAQAAAGATGTKTATLTGTAGDTGGTHLLALRPATAGVDHILLEHDGAGLTCAPETVTVKACANVSCSSLYTAGNVTGNVIWTGSNSVAFSIASGAGQTTVSIPVSSAQTITLGTSNVSPAPAAGSSCSNTAASSTSCNIVFTASSSCFDAVETTKAASTPIYTKLASAQFSLDVLALSTSASYPYTGSVRVALVDPTAASGNCSDSNAGLTAETSYIFTASDNGRKTFSFTYPSAAKNVKVRVRDASANVSNCSADNFAIRPASFVLTTSTALAPATDKLAAGEDFNLTATPYDAAATPAAISLGYTGQPLVDATRVVDHVTPTPVAVGSTLTWNNPTLPAPGSPAAGGFPQAGGGAVSNLFQYQDVGTITFTAGSVQDASFTAVDQVTGTVGGVNHGANGDCVSGSASNALSGGLYGCVIGSGSLGPLGRFYPHHFSVDGSFSPACAGGGFTYMDSDALGATLTVQAQSKANSTTTRYVSPASAYVPVATLGLELFNGPSTTDLLSRLSLPTVPVRNWTLGVYDASNTYRFDARNLATPVVDGPYDSLKFRVTITDATDAVKIATLNGVALSPSASTVDSTTTKVRFGRLWMGNAYGSEKRSLNLPYETQYWNGNAFVKNTLDVCTALTAANFGIGNLKPAGFNPAGYSAPVTAISMGSFSAGGGSITLAAPNVSGSADVVLKLGASLSMCPSWTPAYPSGTPVSADYLRGKWCGSGYDKDPVARATFGISGSSAKKGTIYLRENY